nr:putative ribonuclease H-like domain-containing protein [Tanacetum cinerariifolium]
MKIHVLLVRKASNIEPLIRPILELKGNSVYQEPLRKNGIAERKNRTLIEAARIMLADSLLPILFWAETVNTSCYVQNRVLVTKPHNKTLYELLHGRTPSIGFMRPFGCLVTILNILDPLGKFEGKVDEGFLVGYSIVGNKMHKAFPLPGECSHWQYKFPLPVEGVPTARRMEIPLPRVCTAMMKKLPVKENWQLHMDLFGPTFVKSLSKKSYCLVITDDYSRFSRVFFLASKDETASVLKTFIIGLENLLSLKVKIIRCDNGIEFKNADLNQFCGLKGIKREFIVPWTPQQNGIAEWKNRTLIEAARTLLADSLLPIPFWAEAVNTACYVQNRVLVTKPHNKTPYELLHGRLPSIGFMRPFGCHVTILNTLDPLGKFQGKVDEGFLVGYSVYSKAFRVFNSRTRIVQETLHVNFMENKPNVAGSGPAWLFDIDSLSQTMNYHPVLAENQTHSHAGFQDTEKAREEETQTYVLFPLLSDGSTNPKNNKDAHTDGKEHDDDIQKSVSPDIHSSSCGDQTREQALTADDLAAVTLGGEFLEFEDGGRVIGLL